MTDAGIRLDWNPSKADSLTVESAAYRGVIGLEQIKLVSLSPLSYGGVGLLSNAGGHILTRWSHSFKGSSNLTVQAYYDRSHSGGYTGDNIRTLDFDLQYHFKIGSRKDVMDGLGRREYSDSFRNNFGTGLTPSHEDIDLTSGFVQDEITFVEKKLYFTVGTKAEHSTFSGDNVQPAVQLAWLPTDRQSVWLSASRAVRTASRAERGLYANYGSFQAGPLPGLVYLYGQESARSEGLRAYEAGYRYQAHRNLWFDLTSFYNVYDHLSSVAPGKTFFQQQPAPHFVAPLYFGNKVTGETYGTGVAASYKPASSLSLKGSYTLLRLALHGSNVGLLSEGREGQSPRHQVYIGSFLNLPKSFEISGHAYFVGSLPNLQTPAYTRLDLNVGWKGLENVELMLAGQNLLGSHMEFGDVSTPANVIKRSLYAKIVWRF
jgi:iron complex outermembrane receptor protein